MKFLTLLFLTWVTFSQSMDGNIAEFKYKKYCEDNNMSWQKIAISRRTFYACAEKCNTDPTCSSFVVILQNSDIQCLYPPTLVSCTELENTISEWRVYEKVRTGYMHNLLFFLLFQSFSISSALPHGPHCHKRNRRQLTDLF